MKGAEAAGFTFALISDHLHSWTDRRGYQHRVLAVASRRLEAMQP